MITTQSLGMTFLGGVLFGAGLILAAFLMQSLFHIGFCG